MKTNFTRHTIYAGMHPSLLQKPPVFASLCTQTSFPSLSRFSFIPLIFLSTTNTYKMEDNMNLVLSVVMHVFIGAVLLIYIPTSLLIRLVQRVFIRPFEKEVDLKQKIVLITGASSGIGEVYFPVPFSFFF
jgi:hypothetical protein